jgi:hypothetical protein
VQPLIGADQRGDGRGGLGLALGERIGLQRGKGRRVAGEILHVQRQHAEPRRDMADALDRGEHEARRRDLEGEALADQPGDLRLVVERVGAGDDAARAVAQHVDGQPRMTLLRDPGQPAQVGDVVGDVLHIEALAVRLAAAAQVECMGSEAPGGKLLADPAILPAMRVHAVADHHDRAGRSLRQPGMGVDAHAAGAGEIVFLHGHGSAAFPAW